MDSSAIADFFRKAISGYVFDNDYSSGEGVAQYGTPGKPYSISWTDCLYKEGNYVVQQPDTEEAGESSFLQRERGLGALDAMAHATAKGLSTEMEQTLRTLYETFNTLNGEAEVDKATGYRIRFDYENAS